MPVSTCAFTDDAPKNEPRGARGLPVHDRTAKADFHTLVGNSPASCLARLRHSAASFSQAASVVTSPAGQSGLQPNRISPSAPICLRRVQQSNQQGGPFSRGSCRISPLQNMEGADRYNGKTTPAVRAGVNSLRGSGQRVRSALVMTPSKERQIRVVASTIQHKNLTSVNRHPSIVSLQGNVHPANLGRHFEEQTPRFCRSPCHPPAGGRS